MVKGTGFENIDAMFALADEPGFEGVRDAWPVDSGSHAILCMALTQEGSTVVYGPHTVRHLINNLGGISRMLDGTVIPIGHAEDGKKVFEEAEGILRRVCVQASVVLDAGHDHERGRTVHLWVVRETIDVERVRAAPVVLTNVEHGTAFYCLSPDVRDRLSRTRWHADEVTYDDQTALADLSQLVEASDHHRGLFLKGSGAGTLSDGTRWRQYRYEDRHDKETGDPVYDYIVMVRPGWSWATTTSDDAAEREADQDA